MVAAGGIVVAAVVAAAATAGRSAIGRGLARPFRFYSERKARACGNGCKKFSCANAKAAFSAVVDDAVRGAPCEITRHGRREAVGDRV